MANKPPNPHNQGSPASPSVRSRPREKLAVWFVFSGLVGSATILWSLLGAIFVKPVQASDLLAHGELFIISVSITASAFGDFLYSLINHGHIKNTKNVFFACATFAMTVLSFLGFTSLGVGGKATNAGLYAGISIFLYIVSVIVSANCILLTEEQEETENAVV